MPKNSAKRSASPTPRRRARPEPRLPSSGAKGRRGAPKGNLNALKTGRSSKQLKQFTEQLLADPVFLRLFQAFLGSPEIARTFTIRTGETYLRRIRRNKERERRQLQRRYEPLPYFDEGEAPW